MSNNVSTSFQVQASAKLLLLGEYLALLGESALGISLQQKMTMQYENTDTEFIILSQKKVPQEFYVYLQSLCDELCISYPTGIANVTSNIPVASGLGSSAAFSVCIAKIILLNNTQQTDENTLSPYEIWKLAHKVEGFFHNTASGIDTAIVSFEGTVLIEKSYLPNDNPSNFTIRHIELPIENKIYVGSRERHSGKKSIPQQMENIRELLQVNDHAVREWLSMHRKAVRYVLDYTMHNSKDELRFLKTFGCYISELHHILSQIKMSTPEIDVIIQENIERGAFGGKITGACFGGSFYMLSKHVLKL